MKEEYNNENRGVLFSNDNKERETQPDFKGTINVEGKEYWLSMWDKESKNGKPYLSLSVQPKEESKGRNSDSWQAARQKFAKDEPEDRNDDSAKNEVLLDDEQAEKISLDDIPF